MGKLERREGPGRAAKPDTLAGRINAEHRACKEAIVATLRHVGEAADHALNAGDLLIRAKAEHGKYGEWTKWVQKNTDLSTRRAQEYVYMAERRDELEEAKARGSAFSSLQGALEYLRRARYVPGWQQQRSVDPVPEAKPGTEIDQSLERGLEEEREFWEAWKRPQKEALARMRAADRKERRVREAGERLRAVAAGLHELLDPHNGYRPEEAGAALAQVRGGAEAVALLREGVAWLTRVIEEVEQARGAMQERE